MRIGSLFSGIGGLELGLERAGVGRAVWQCEQNAYCREVLARHWPEARRYEDVRDLVGASLPAVDVLCGGPPCQDLSDAGTNHKRPGLEGERSGLAWTMMDLVEQLGPRWVVWENVDGAAWKRWVPAVRRKLHELGYYSLPVRLRACDVGAPFQGRRVFVLATPYGEGESARALHAEVAELSELARSHREDWGRPSPRAMGMADGLPRRVDRLRALGNAVMPAQARLIGALIVGAERRLAAGT